MVDAVERRRQIRVQHPPALRVLPIQRQVDRRNRVLAATARPKPIGPRLKPRLPLGLQRVEGTCLQHAINDHGNTKRALLRTASLRDVHPLERTSMPRLGCALHPFGQLHLGLGREHHLTVDARRLAASIALRHPPHAHQRVGARAEHQLLQVADLLEVPRLRRREDPLPQPPYVFLRGTPINSAPDEDRVLWSVRRDNRRGVQLAHRFGRCGHLPLHRLTWPPGRPFGPGHTGPYPASYPGRPAEEPAILSRFPAVFRLPAFASWPSCARWGVGLPLRSAYRAAVPGPHGVVAFPTSEMRPGWVPPIPRDCAALPTGLGSSGRRRRFPAASPGPRSSNPSAGLPMTRHQQGFTCVHPSGLPLHL